MNAADVSLELKFEDVGIGKSLTIELGGVSITDHSVHLVLNQQNQSLKKLILKAKISKNSNQITLSIVTFINSTD